LALAPVGGELHPAGRARILRLLIQRIDVAPDGIFLAAAEWPSLRRRRARSKVVCG
jgi:hypothetical protein